MKKFYFKTGLMMLMLIMAQAVWGKSDSGLPADSSNFVTASIVITSPTTDVYSVFGHSALRMECPSHGLDYVFSFESDASVSGFLTFFAGTAKAAFVAVPTQQYVADMKREGRGVTQYRLNLTLHEKQQLWKLLDEDMVEGVHRRFTLLPSNCTSMLLMKVNQSLIGERLVWAEWKDRPYTDNGGFIRYNTTASPWAEFLFVTFLGTIYDECYPQDILLSPRNLVENMRRANFVNAATGMRRPAMTDVGKVLAEPVKTETRRILAPDMCFLALLLTVLAVTLGEWKWGWKKSAGVLDAVLLALQTAAGVALLYIVIGSSVFGHRWNWYLVPFNPLPVLLWMGVRRHPKYGNLYLFYSAVLLAFLALTPFVGQLDYAHQLLTATLAVRCVSRYNKFKSNYKLQML